MKIVFRQCPWPLWCTGVSSQLCPNRPTALIINELNSSSFPECRVISKKKSLVIYIMILSTWWMIHIAKGKRSSLKTFDGRTSEIKLWKTMNSQSYNNSQSFVHVVSRSAATVRREALQADVGGAGAANSPTSEFRIFRWKQHWTFDLICAGVKPHKPLFSYLRFYCCKCLLKAFTLLLFLQLSLTLGDFGFIHVFFCSFVQSTICCTED